MAVIDKLAPLRAHAGTRRTVGLDDAIVARFAAIAPRPGRSHRRGRRRIRAHHGPSSPTCSTSTRTRRCAPCRPATSTSTPDDAREPVRRPRRARPVGRHAQGRRAARLRRLRHARLRPHAQGRARRDGQAAGDGQHHDADPVAAALRAGAPRRDRPHPRRLPVRQVPVPELGFGIGVAGRAHRRRQRQADDRPGRDATPAARSSASW